MYYLSDPHGGPASIIRGVAMHVVVRPDIKQKLVEMAAKESRTLSAMTSLILTRALSNELGPA
jgi:hypothetical protein